MNDRDGSINFELYNVLAKIFNINDKCSNRVNIDWDVSKGRNRVFSSPKLLTV